ncbi:hypothetical protein [Hymenobacter terrenus]|uniref:hypothetical protein n=1 Tax=Hymenobacter terrenus TaxID=1629124 RepID=UPI0006191336|nr:hypothetical protein [Hymenobacter terrenus]
MKRLLFAFFLLGSSPYLALAQSAFDVPARLSLSKPEDYAQYEPQVISTINWLEETPANQDVTRRQQAQRFLLTWANGSPKVSMGLQPYVGELYDKNTALLMAFMGGWTRFSLQHPNEKDVVRLNAEGVKSMLKVYELGGSEKNKAMENLRDVINKGELETWLKSKITK